ncbi:MAG: DUF4347 domain-containing protein, partial [Pseudomonadota bacterium]
MLSRFGDIFRRTSGERVEAPTAHKPLMRVLEPRVLLDAAGVETARDMADQTVHADIADNVVAELNETLPAEGHVPAQRDLSRDIVFIDGNVEDIGELLMDIDPDVEVHVLDLQSDGVEQIADILDTREDIAAVHIFSHGGEGFLNLGSSQLTGGTITTSHVEALTRIGAALSEDGDILLYGCDFGAGTAGRAAAAQLAAVTGADIAASNDLTGSEEQGGDWDLEVVEGQVEARGYQLEGFDGLLAAFELGALTEPVVNYEDPNGAPGNTDFQVVIDGRTVGTTGTVATWENAGTFEGPNGPVAVDLVATVVGVSDPATMGAGFGTRSFDANQDGDPTLDDFRIQVVNDNPPTGLQLFTNNGGSFPQRGYGYVDIEWTIVDATTGAIMPVGDIDFTLSDIDGSQGNPNSREEVTVALDDLASYTFEASSNLEAVNTGTGINVSGTEDQGDEQNSWVTLSWESTNALSVRYGSYTGNSFYNHDGDGELTIDNPVTYYASDIDLDADDSSGATGSAFAQTYLLQDTVPGYPVSIVDGDVDVINFGQNATDARITLTNTQPGDQLTWDQTVFDALGLTISSSVGGGGEIIVDISGRTSTADYESAFQALRFSNTQAGFAGTPSAPSTVDRILNFQVFDDAFSSQTVQTTITIADGSGEPNGVQDVFVTDQGNAVSRTAGNGLLFNDVDPNGLPLTIASAVDRDGNAITVNAVGAAAPVSATLPSGSTLTLYADGSFDYTPSANFIGTEYFDYTLTNGATTAETYAAFNVQGTGWILTGSSLVNEGQSAGYSIEYTEPLTPGSSVSVDIGTLNLTSSDADFDTSLNADVLAAIQNAIIGKPEYTLVGNTLTYTVANPITVTQDTSASGFVDISGNPSATDLGFDDESISGALAIPFGFDFYGTTYNEIYVTDNGWASFVQPTNAFWNNQDLTNGTAAGGLPIIAGLWDDLHTGLGGTVYVNTVGPVGDREFIIQFDDVDHYNSQGTEITFQMVLQEATGAVIFRYDDVNFGNQAWNDGASASIGIQSGTGFSEAFSFNFASLSDNSSITFAPSTDPVTPEVLSFGLGNVDDTLAEGNETYQLTLSNAVNSTVSVADSVTTTIADDENSVPLAADDTFAVQGGTATIIDPRINDDDPDNDALVILNITDPAAPGAPIVLTNGVPVTLASGTTVERQADGTLLVLRPVGSPETETFDYEITDQVGGFDSATITLARDTDGDGVIDSVDIDDDNDGIIDINERAPVAFTSADTFNAPGYPNTNNTDNPGSFTGLAPAGDTTVDFNYQLDGSATWQNGVSIRNNQNGVVGEFVRAQARNTDFDAGNTATYTYDFTTPVTNVSFTIGGIDSGDTVRIQAVVDGVLTDLPASAFSDLDADLSNYNGEANTFISNAGGSNNLGINTLDVSVTGPVEAIVITTGKSPGSNAAVTIGFSGLEYEGLASLDSDNDGLIDARDLDSDNDGITDSVEGQITAGYIAPTGSDSDGDGLLDVYDADTGSTDATLSAGLGFVDTDGDGRADRIDADSDNDGTGDIAERGDGGPTTITSTTDSDNDGLLDIFEGSDVADGFDANDENLEPTNTTFNLSGVPALNPDGSNAVPLDIDLDFRDSPNAPTAADDAQTTAEDTAVSGAVVLNDVDGDTLTATLSTVSAEQPQNGSVVVNTDGTYTYTPNADFNGTDSFVVLVDDGNGGTDTATVTITVTPVNDAPTAADDAQTTNEDTAVS